MAEALYRKYRPQIFEDVVGQEHIERTLKNAIASDKVSHAYLFTGPRGTGKTTTARLLAKALLCEHGPTPDPDGTCEDCELVAKGEHPDVYELDAASRTGVENVREEIIGRVNYAPTRGRYKIYIIDEVHMLSVAAFNALLKTLEEPPSHVVFILCTTDPHKVPETIHSRCQRFDFRRIAAEELISRLGYICGMEGISFEPEALDLIAHRAQGGMRDALTSLEQLIAFSDGEITTEQAERMLGSVDSNDMAEIVLAIGKRDAAQCFRWTRQYMETGADLAQFTQDLAEHIRDMYVVSLTGSGIALDLTEAARRELESELALFGPDRLSRMLCVLGDLIADLKTSSNQRLSFEIALTRLIRPDSDITLESLAERLERLERGGVVAAPASASVANGASGAAQTAAAEAKSSSVQQNVQPVQPADQTRQPASAAGDAVQPMPAHQPAVQEAHEHETAAQTQAQPQTTLELSEAKMPQIWNAVFAQLKKAAIQYGALFMNVKPAFDETTSTVIINFDSDNNFGFSTAQSPKVRDALSDAFAKAGYPGVAIRIAQADIGDAVISGGHDSAVAASGGVTSSQPVAQPVAAQSGPQDASAASEERPVATQQVQDSLAGESPTPSSDTQPQTHTQSEARSVHDDQPMEGQADIADLLSSTFGEGIVFEEVD